MPAENQSRSEYDPNSTMGSGAIIEKLSDGTVLGFRGALGELPEGVDEQAGTISEWPIPEIMIDPIKTRFQLPTEVRNLRGFQYTPKTERPAETLGGPAVEPDVQATVAVVPDKQQAVASPPDVGVPAGRPLEAAIGGIKQILKHSTSGSPFDLSSRAERFHEQAKDQSPPQ